MTTFPRGADAGLRSVVHVSRVLPGGRGASRFFGEIRQQSSIFRIHWSGSPLSFLSPPQPNPHLPLFIVLEPKKLPAYLLGSFRRTDPHHPHSPNTTGDRRRSAVVCHSVFRGQAFLSDPTSVDRSYHGDPPNPSRHVSFRQHHPSCSLRVVRIDPCVTNANYTERCGEICAVRGG
jgi:hypothetical protein